ncbi:ferritin-like domain-containing protein [Ephemerocybe angulata]|uniref:Ferritin-like domain-containing protein n=1 Tax=Ephemerocybe angulata TaxID=980116 RepID=A0A8H6LX15_9AGAR|nr:ferritin-like domain-containing protein [Tulosesus angulatus]
MKLSRCLTLLAALLPITLAAPAPSSARRQVAADNDYSTSTSTHSSTVILTFSLPTVSRFLVYALSLEQLAVSFYHSSLSLLSADDFRAAGHPDSVRRGYEQVLKSAKAHSDYLVGEITNLGHADSTAGCDYAFPVKTTEDFINMSEAIQALAVSTYVGALDRSQSDTYTTVFGGMLGVEARYANWISTAVKYQDLADMSFEYPSSMNDTWTIAGLYVTGCPPGIAPEDIFPAGLVDWPVLTLPDTVYPGQSISISFPNTLYTEQDTLYAGFRTGMDTDMYPLVGNDDGSFSVTVPQNVDGKGAVWLSVVKGDGLSVRDDNMVAGPALLMMAAGQEMDGAERDGAERDGAESAVNKNAWSW